MPELDLRVSVVRDAYELMEGVDRNLALYVKTESNSPQGYFLDFDDIRMKGVDLMNHAKLRWTNSDELTDVISSINGMKESISEFSNKLEDSWRWKKAFNAGIEPFIRDMVKYGVNPEETMYLAGKMGMKQDDRLTTGMMDHGQNIFMKYKIAEITDK